MSSDTFDGTDLSLHPFTRQILGADGVLLDGCVAPMSDDMALEALRWMTLSRRADARMISLQRQGRMGTFSAVHGQEAAVVGTHLAADIGTDWLVPAYREMPAMIRHGYPLDRFMMYWKGNPVGGRIPDDVKMLPVQIALGAQLPHAVGLAWGAQLQGESDIVFVYFGEGASSEGDFHESMNLAGVMSAPVVFCLQNNGWAISTPRHRQSATASFAARAAGYGIPGIAVDGNDLFAVYEVAVEAAERARRGQGPTLIELVTYRMGAHNTADDPTKYGHSDPEGRWASSDPIDRVVRYLSARGVVSDELLASIEADADAQIDEAISSAESFPPPGVDHVFNEVFANPPVRVLNQWATAKEEHSS